MGALRLRLATRTWTCRRRQVQHCFCFLGITFRKSGRTHGGWWTCRPPGMCMLLGAHSVAIGAIRLCGQRTVASAVCLVCARMHRVWTAQHLKRRRACQQSGHTCYRETVGQVQQALEELGRRVARSDGACMDSIQALRDDVSSSVASLREQRQQGEAVAAELRVVVHEVETATTSKLDAMQGHVQVGRHPLGRCSLQHPSSAFSLKRLLCTSYAWPLTHAHNLTFLAMLKCSFLHSFCWSVLFAQNRPSLLRTVPCLQDVLKWL
jgi:hypothetical protein